MVQKNINERLLTALKKGPHFIQGVGVDITKKQQKKKIGYIHDLFS